MSLKENCKCGHPEWMHSKKMAKDDKFRCEGLEMIYYFTYKYCRCKKFKVR